eukprot:SAG31_NODE_7468_length_1681_cov_2.532238_1_plen_158_part_10
MYEFMGLCMAVGDCLSPSLAMSMTCRSHAAATRASTAKALLSAIEGSRTHRSLSLLGSKYSLWYLTALLITLQVHLARCCSGLSYTQFAYELVATSSGVPEALACSESQCLRVNITNTGQRAGAEVAQLYLTFPPSAVQPAPVLKGFCKTKLIAPGES